MPTNAAFRILVFTERAETVVLNKEAAVNATPWCLLWKEGKHISWMKGQLDDSLATKLAYKTQKAPYYSGGRFGASECSFATAVS